MGHERVVPEAIKALCIGAALAGALPDLAQAADTTMAQDTVVQAPWAPATDDMMEGGVAYFTIRNTSDHSIRLIEVQTEVAHLVTFGESWTETDGNVRHSAIFQLTVPAKGSVSLEPGGQLVLLRDLTEPLVKGTVFPLHLTFYDGSQTSIDVPVRGADGTAPKG